MIVYFLQYLFVAFFSFLSGLKYKSTVYFKPAIFLLLFLVAALRGFGVDRDYSNYYMLFNKLSTVAYFSKRAYMYFEPAFFYIPVLSKFFFGPFFLEVTFIVFAFLGVFFKLRSLSISNSFFLSCLLYIASWYVLHEMTQIRAGVAIGILLCSIKVIYERRPVAFLFYVLAASCFHYSSAIFIFAYLLHPDKFSKIINLGLILISLALVFLKIDFLDILIKILNMPKLNDYKIQMAQGMYKKINVFNILFIINSVVAVFLILYVDRLKENNIYAFLLTKIYVVSIILYLGLSSIPVLAMRLSEIYGAVQIILFPAVIYVFDKKYMGYIILIFLFLITFYNTFFVSKLLGSYYTWL